MPLPIGDFKLIENPLELQDLAFDKVDPNGPIGYVINADFEYPKNIRDKTNLFPLMPEHYTVQPEDLSPSQKPALKGNMRKLTATFKKRCGYTTTLLNFQLNTKLGIKVKKINWAIQFHQATIFKTWIERCTKLRNSTTVAFFIAIAKLLANAVSNPV